METNLELSKNLKLVNIDENSVMDGKLSGVVLGFDFFDEDGIAFISIDNLENDYPSYAMTEIVSELADSFNELLEENWEAIVAKVKEFKAQWDTLN